jgi:hypothetical protein
MICERLTCHIQAQYSDTVTFGSLLVQARPRLLPMAELNSFSRLVMDSNESSRAVSSASMRHKNRLEMFPLAVALDPIVWHALPGKFGDHYQ